MTTAPDGFPRTDSQFDDLLADMADPSGPTLATVVDYLRYARTLDDPTWADLIRTTIIDSYDPDLDDDDPTLWAEVTP